MGKTDLLASPTPAAESPATGVWERLQSIRQRFDPREVFYSHIGHAEISRKMEPRGFEPLTSSMPLRRSTN